MIFSIVIILFVGFNLSYFSMLFQGIGKDGFANGEILKRKSLPREIQTITGNRTQNLDMIFSYRYTVNGKEYQDSTKLGYSIINSLQLVKMQKATLPVKILVKYDKEHPAKAVIWIP